MLRSRIMGVLRSRITLCIWLLGILFPLAWLGRFSEAYRQTFDAIFGPEWMHLIMHACLFGVLGILLVIVIKRPISVRTAAYMALLFLAVGTLQEFFQSYSQGHWLFERQIVCPVTTDLLVDLSGGLAGPIILQLARRWKVRQIRYASDEKGR